MTYRDILVHVPLTRCKEKIEVGVSLGGATRHVLEHMTVPVFMVH